MLASARLKEAIEAWAFKLQRESPLLSLARAGRLTPGGMALYLVSLRYLFQCSRRNLQRAAERCAEHGEAELSQYFMRKADEESGHDLWAEDDLAHLGDSLWRSLDPAPGVLALVSLQNELVETDPLGLVAYGLWAEYFTVLLGDEWLDALAASGYGRRQVSAVAKHVEADRAHAAATLAEIDVYVRESTSVSSLLSVVHEAGRHFEALCDQVHQAALPAT